MDALGVEPDDHAAQPSSAQNATRRPAPSPKQKCRSVFQLNGTIAESAARAAG
ncbi:hypothetical protein MYA_1588 [Burkholderia sp. KJ006]|nr:hypothetical protein MYA_1588 [Burkholderia sp. KJ006]